MQMVAAVRRKQRGSGLTQPRPGEYIDSIDIYFDVIVYFVYLLSNLYQRLSHLLVINLIIDISLSLHPWNPQLVHFHSQLEQIIQALTLGLCLGHIVSPDVAIVD